MSETAHDPERRYLVKNLFDELQELFQQHNPSIVGINSRTVAALTAEDDRIGIVIDNEITWQFSDALAGKAEEEAAKVPTFKIRVISKKNLDGFEFIVQEDDIYTCGLEEPHHIVAGAEDIDELSHFLKVFEFTAMSADDEEIAQMFMELGATDPKATKSILRRLIKRAKRRL